MGPPPITASVAGTSVTFMASRLVQYGVSASPSIGGRAGSVPVLSTTPRAASNASLPSPVSTTTRPDTVEAAVAADDADARLLERTRVVVVGPVVVGLPDPGRHQGPVRPDLDLTGQAGCPPRLGEQVGRPDHQLGRGAAPERALAADQGPLDPDHVQPRLGELARGVLAAGAEAEHHDVDLLG